LHPSGHRYYDEADLQTLYGGEPLSQKIVVYCRVSSAKQKDDLESQVKAMEQFCLQTGTAVDEWIKEIAGGMNFNP
jgi:putative resolvase